MPPRCDIDPAFAGLLDWQEAVVRREQALAAGMTRRVIEYRQSTGRWQLLLPNTYLTHPGAPTRLQRLIAAQLWAGENSAVDAADGCRWHGLNSVAIDPDRVHVVTPWEEGRRDTGFVVVRRTIAPIRMVGTDRLRVVDAATAVIAATRTMTNDRAVLAALSDAVQRKIVTYDELVRAHIEGPPRGARAADKALEYIGAGAHSAPEADFLKLVAASPILPTPVCNSLIRLRSGRMISFDAWFVDAAVVHETNGRKAHEREDLFDDMQDRHDDATDSEFLAFHSSPKRIDTKSRLVIAQLERAVVRRAGRGIPEGVEVISMGGSTR